MNSIPLKTFLLSAAILASTVFGQSIEHNDSQSLRATTPATDSKTIDAPKVAHLIVDKTNDFRNAQERPKLKANDRLTATAKSLAHYMARTNQFGHTVDGKRPSERAKESGYDYCLVTENIGYQWSSGELPPAELAERFLEGWKKSPTHRENMLDPDVMETGVAVAQSEDTGYWYAVQMFGRPRSAAIEFQITNETNSPVEYAIDEQTYTLPPRYTRSHMRCRSTTATFEFPEVLGGAKRIEVKRDDRYRIVHRNGKLDVQQVERSQE